MAKRAKSKEVLLFESQGINAFCERDLPFAIDKFCMAMQRSFEETVKVGAEATVDSPASQQCGGILQVIERAMNDAEKKIKAQPFCSQGYLTKAFVLVLQDRWIEARETYIKGINLCTDCSSLRSALNKLDETEELYMSVSHMNSTDTESCSGDDNRSSENKEHIPIRRSRKFRLQHQKRLSKTKLDVDISRISTVYTTDIKPESTWL